jgi:hypothetical protein
MMATWSSGKPYGLRPRLQDGFIVVFLTAGNLRGSRPMLVSSATTLEGEQKLGARVKNSEGAKQEKQIRHACIVPGQVALSRQ